MGRHFSRKQKEKRLHNMRTMLSKQLLQKGHYYQSLFWCYIKHLAHHAGSRCVHSASAAQWSARTVITNHLHSKNSCEALSCPTTGHVLDYLGRHCSRPRWSWQTYNFETKTNKQKELWGALTGLVLDNLGRHCSRPRRSSYLKFLCCISYWSTFS